MFESGNDDNPDSIRFFPFAYALLDDKLDDYCWYCLQKRQSLRGCKGCNVAKFCDKECQSMGWNDHKMECKGFANATKPPNFEVRFLGRIVSRYQIIANGKDKDDPFFYKNRTSKRSLMELCSHSSIMRGNIEIMKCFDDIYRQLSEFYGKKQCIINKELVFELYCREMINRHSIGDNSFLEEIAKGLYLDLSAYDHSCRPNAIYSMFLCDGFVAILKKLDPNCHLFDTKNTFITYIDLRNSRPERQKLLRDFWYFDCKCIRCTDEAEDDILTSILCPNCNKCEKNEEKIIYFPNFIDYKENLQQHLTCQTCLNAADNSYIVKARDLMIYLADIFDRNIFKNIDNETAIKCLEHLLKKCSSILPKFNIFYFKILTALIGVTNPDSYETMLNYHVETLKCMRLCFPKNHPMLAHHLQNIGICYRNLKERKKSLAYMKESAEMFKFLFGDNHSITNDIENFISKC